MVGAAAEPQVIRDERGGMNGRAVGRCVHRDNFPVGIR